MYISRLIAKNWRNFTNIDVSLGETVYLAGPNASGKSNFLDIFRFLRDIVNPDGGGLQKAINLRGGLKKIRCLAARQKPNVEIQVEMKKSVLDRQSPPDWVYQLEFGNDKTKKNQPRIFNEKVLRIESGSQKNVISRPDQDDLLDPKRLTQTFLEQVNTNQQFREVADCFNEVLYLHLVPQLLKFGNQLAIQKMESDPFGQGFLDAVATVPQKTQASRLKRIGDILKKAVPQLESLEFVRDEITGAPHLQIRYEHWRPNGGWQREDQFSDGTLRLISLLWTLMSSNNLILLEEPELSLHGKIVEQIPQVIYRSRASRKVAGGQVLISTHSEKLLSDKSLDGNSFLIVRPGAKGESSRIEPLNDDDKLAIKSGVSPAEIVFAQTEHFVERMSL